MRTWDLFKKVFELRKQGYSVSEIAKEVGKAPKTVSFILKLEREKLESRGINPDLLYDRLERGMLSPYYVIQLLADQDFVEVLNIEDDEEFMRKASRFIDMRIKAKSKKVELSELLELVLLGRVKRILEDNEIKLGEIFFLNVEPIPTKITLSEDGRTLTIQIGAGLLEEDEEIYEVSPQKVVEDKIENVEVVE